MLLLQMTNRNIVSAINGCISTSNVANVYHAIALPDADFDASLLHCAIKGYKTAILAFKYCDKHITSEHRFRDGYQRLSSCAMVELRAEKEMRNLKRLHAGGIPCPEIVYVRQHVRIIGFLSDKEGYSAPRLKNSKFEDDDAQRAALWRDCYQTCLAYMRAMYQSYRLVHGDSSEYNIFFYKGKLYIIDVSQSLE